MINVLLPSMQDVQNGVIIAIRTLLLHLCEPVYKLIVFCFQIFEGFGKLRLFENSDVIAQIYNRIGLILGLFMIFRITFSAIEYIINPDNIFDKEKGIGNIVKRVLIVIVLLGSTRFLFDEAYDIQDKLIDSQIVSKLLLTDPTISYEDNGGAIIAWTAFNTFYRINPEASGDERDTCAEMMDENGVIYENFFESEGNLLDSAGYCLNAVDESETNVIIFNGVFCLGVGAFLLWTIFTYTVQAGVRVLQLAYLELIAPVPIMMYLTPDGDSKLKNWGQQCLTTFLDFFIRVAIMDFIIIVSGTLIDMQSNILGYFGDIQTSNGNLAEMYVILIMIIALMIFAKRIPNLLKEILPSTGGTASLGFGFGLTGETKKVGGFLGGLAGGVIGATAGGAINAGISAFDRGVTAHRLGRRGWSTIGAAASGLGGGFQRGFRNGAHRGNPITNFRNGFQARHDADRNYEQLITSGGTARGRISSQITSHFGETKGQQYSRMVANMDRIDEFRNSMYDKADQISSVKSAKETWENMLQYQGEPNAAYELRKRQAYDRYITTRNGVISKALQNRDDTHFSTDSDKTQASEIRSIVSDVNKFIDSNSVQIWNETTGQYEAASRPIRGRADLESLNRQANETRTHITSQSDYGSAIANDRAAGLDNSNNN